MVRVQKRSWSTNVAGIVPSYESWNAVIPGQKIQCFHTYKCQNMGSKCGHSFCSLATCNSATIPLHVKAGLLIKECDTFSTHLNMMCIVVGMRPSQRSDVTLAMQMLATLDTSNINQGENIKNTVKKVSLLFKTPKSSAMAHHANITLRITQP